MAQSSRALKYEGRKQIKNTFLGRENNSEETLLETAGKQK